MLPREIIKRVREIQVRTGRQVADVLAGQYESVFKGRGIEFDEVRPYLPGDDVRLIDWNVTARMGEPFIKKYVEERQLTLMLMADISASLDFGSTYRSKREAAAELCACWPFPQPATMTRSASCYSMGGSSNISPRGRDSDIPCVWSAKCSPTAKPTIGGLFMFPTVFPGDHNSGCGQLCTTPVSPERSSF